jgi:drug/metabolite transporter (DMT)-like permease
MSVLLAYLFYFVAASASPLQRRALAVKKDGGALGQIRFSFEVMSVIAVLGLLIPFFSPLHFSSDHVQLVVLTLICGIFGAAYFCCNYIAQKHVEAGVTSLVSNIYTPFAIIGATLFLGEALTTQQILGTVLLLIGIVIVSKKHHTGTFRFDKYFVLMAGSGVMLGVLLVTERALQVETGLAAATLLSWWSQLIALGILVLITKSKSSYSYKDIGITGSLRFLQALSWVILVYVVGNLSVVSSITTFKVVLMFILGAVFLHEREDLPRKIFGSVVALAGLLLM